MKIKADPQKTLTEAEQLFSTGKLEAAAEKYLRLVKDAFFAPFAYYRIAAISNIAQEPLKAKELYYKAFSLKPDICTNMLDKNHPNYNYVFKGKKDESPQEGCPLCGKNGYAYWCYPLIEMGSTHVQAYNPIRVWLRCDDCHHLYAEEFPEQKIQKLTEQQVKDLQLQNKPIGMPTKPHLFSYYSGILSELTKFTVGIELLEIGLGGCECALAATEMGYSVFGIDISGGCVVQALKYGISAEQHDFMQYKTNRKWDIIVLGDVIEHVSNPRRAIEKVYDLLDDNGAIWISTPNFDSAFSMYAGHNDPMRREGSHKNYFSRFSLINLLVESQLIPVDYRISSHYNGSMEIIAMKKAAIPASDSKYTV